MNKGSTLATVSGAKVDFRKGDPPNGRVYLLVRIYRLPSRVHNAESATYFRKIIQDAQSFASGVT